MNNQKQSPVALTVAGSDCSGGAGIQADLKTFAVLGAYGASVITALTAQNTQGVSAIHAVPPEFVMRQIDMVFSDLDVAAVKVGMLATRNVIEAVDKGLDCFIGPPVVVDPVMVASSGDVLIEPNAEEALRELIVPRATLLTPNMHEAARLLGASVARDEEGLFTQAEGLLALGPKSVLVKGGHEAGSDAVDVFFDGMDRVTIRAGRIDTKNDHGTGCTLSAAIVAGLAQGRSLIEAIRRGKWFVTEALKAGVELRIGRGRGPLDHAAAGRSYWGEHLKPRKTKAVQTR